MKHGVFKEGNKYIAYVNGEKVYSARMEEHAQSKFRKYSKTAVAAVTEETQNTPKFSINKRFSFLEKSVAMVATGIQNSVIICGAGGLGKSYTVLKTLKNLGYDESGEGHRSFKVVKGFSTAKGLYRLLYENNDKILVLDDCDSVWKDNNSLNLLKSALDSYETRVISWNSERMDEDLPSSFLYTGKVIFITNLSESQLDQAVRSRCLFIDVSMSRDDIIERMKVITSSDEFLPGISDDSKRKAIQFIEKNIKIIRNISLRTLVNITKIAETGSDDWEEMATYIAVNN